MIILSKHLELLLLILLSVLASCKNDMNVMAPYQAVPVVYCLLNPNDTVQYLRLEKTFLGAGNAYDMAKIADSIYYPEAQVNLEKWLNGVMKERMALELTAVPARESGIFTSDPNYLYLLKNPVQADCEYRLNISIPSSGTTISATTRTFGSFKIIRPESYKKNLAFSSYDNYQTVEWLTSPLTRIYHLNILFHYLEVVNKDTAKLTATWNIGDFISVNSLGGEKMNADVLQRNFYKWIGSRLAKPAGNVQRIASKQAIDFVFTVGGEDLYTYMQIYKDDGGPPTEKPVYTNVTNGIGLFSARLDQSVKGKSLSDHSIDSLAYGIYTKHLGFADSQNDYYFTGF